MRPPLAAALVGFLILTSGCLGLTAPDQPSSDQRALDALNRSQNATADVTSYRTTVDGTLSASESDDSVTLEVTGNVAVDVAGRRMNATTGIEDVDGTIRTRQTAPKRAYISGYTAYTECARMGWERQNLSESRSWLTYTPVGQQLAVLNETNVYWRGTEVIDGTETVVVVGYPSKQALRAVPDVRGASATEVQDANIENATVTLWLDSETHRPVQAQREIEVADSGATATATVTFDFAGYDEPTSVRRPEFDEDEIWQLGCPGTT
ncbi:hypothetical protein [Halobellus inordinatus]|uniref:hypothetical protein n=1 Tax=Halobellus inordinatus TaxID=1126236 RepID=UPI00210CC167|nr:hypothetical protein [Halobellus inordinatus]